MKTSSTHHYRSPILSSASASAQHYYHHHHHHHHHLLYHHHHYCPPVPMASAQQQRQRQAMVANSQTSTPMNSENNNNNYYYGDNNSNFGAAAAKSRTMDSLNYWKRAFGNPEQSMAGDLGLSERLIRIGGGAVGLVGGNICAQTGKCLAKDKKAVTNKLGCKYRAGALKMLSPIQNSSAFLDNPSPLLPMVGKIANVVIDSGVDDKCSSKVNDSDDTVDDDLPSLAEEVESMTNVPSKIEANAVEKRQPSPRDKEAEERLFYIGGNSVNNYNEILSTSSCKFSKQQEHRVGGGGKTGGVSRYDDEDGTLVFAIEI